MKRLILVFLLLRLIAVPVSASNLQIPDPPPGAQAYLPGENESLLSGFLEIISKGIAEVLPGVKTAAAMCAGALAASILCCLFPGVDGSADLTARLVGTMAISGLLLGSADALLRQALDTVSELADYGKLLLPVMTGSLAASGGTGKAAGLYLGTAFFNSLLSSALSDVIVPMVYVFLALTVAAAAIGNPLLKRLRELMKGLVTWALKLILYGFSGYMALTGVISGTADAAALKAAKMTISGAVPVVGGMISDATETILVSAGAIRSAAGLSGLAAVLALVVVPFLRSGVQYLLLKLTGSLCAVTGSAEHAALIEGIGQAMGIVLGMIGTAALLQLISIVCFMKGVT